MKNTYRGYTLVLETDGTASIFGNETPLARGVLQKLVPFLIDKLGFSLEEIEIAIEQLDREMHEKAYFGTNRYFLFTKDKYCGAA
jgi:hypothetical protein